MLRALVSAALTACFAGFAIAQEPAPVTSADYYADPGMATDASCPDGTLGGQGYGHHGHHHGNVTYPPHWGLAYASGYPNGIVNYGNPPYIRDWRGPGLGCRSCSNGECLYRFYGQPDLFYNYYAWPSCTGLGAELYVSPRPVPPNVGQTYITYQPFYPHEYMYHHHRTYHRYYNGGQGLNRTCVTYWPSFLPWR